MTAVPSSSIATWIAANKWSVWRVINSAAILFSLFIPWRVMDRDPFHHQDLIFTGLQMLQWYRRLGLTFALDEELPSDVRITTALYLLAYCFLGLAALLMYCILNAIVGGVAVQMMGKLSWRILAICLICLAAFALWNILPPNLTDWSSLSSVLWGYWLAVAALISSLVLELGHLLSKASPN